MKSPPERASSGRHLSGRVGPSPSVPTEFDWPGFWGTLPWTWSGTTTTVQERFNDQKHHTKESDFWLQSRTLSSFRKRTISADFFDNRIWTFFWKIVCFTSQIFFQFRSAFSGLLTNAALVSTVTEHTKELLRPLCVHYTPAIQSDNDYCVTPPSVQQPKRQWLLYDHYVEPLLWLDLTLIALGVSLTVHRPSATGLSHFNWLTFVLYWIHCDYLCLAKVCGKAISCSGLQGQ